MTSKFGDQPVKSVMSRQVVSISHHETLHEALRLMTDNRVAAIPVVDQHDTCIGILSTSDLIDVTREVDEELYQHEDDDSPRGWLVGLLADRLGHQHVESVMTDSVATVSPTTTVTDAAAEMLENFVHRLPVVSDSGKLLGIVSATDILRALVDVRS